MSKPTTFDDAFKILDQAITDQQTPALRDLINDELQILKTIIRAQAQDSINEIGRGRDEFTGLLQELSSRGIGHAGDVAAKVDRHVRQNPLLYIGGAAAVALALGFFVSRPRAEKPIAVEALSETPAESDFQNDPYADLDEVQ